MSKTVEKAPVAEPVPGREPVLTERWPMFMRDFWDRDWWPWVEGFRFPKLTEEIKVEEHLLDDMWVIRAEVPGIDPDHDAELTLHDGLLTLKVERRQETKEDKEGRVRTEFRYGSFMRTLPVPKGVQPEAITATYTDGILEVKVPMPKEMTAKAGTKVPISRT